MTLLLPDGSPYVPHEGKAEVAQKAATGAGVGFYSAGHTPLSSHERTPQALMKRAQLAYHVNPWVGTAETVVTRKVVGLPWHLEDGNDEEWGDEGTPDTAEVKSARLLIERPQVAVGNLHPGTATRRLMLSLTSRHLGLCGMTHWYGDQMDTAGIPLAWLYLNPARMWAFEDDRGNLEGWMLDATGTNGKGKPYGGTPLELSEVLTFYLDPPDHGHYGTGLYERAMLKAQITNLADQHSGYVLGTGGRIAGIVSPKEGSIPDEKFAVLVKEFRNVNEAPDAAKRTTIMQGPTDFTPTAADPSELNLVEMAKMNRDDVFTIWGVPNSQAGVETPAGLNSGSTKTADEAILMQGPVHDRVGAIRETLQYGWLDKYLPVVIELEIVEPDFDDETPAYERLSKAVSAPLTNAQRLDILGFPPTGDPAIDNAILLPSYTTLWATAPGKPGEVAAIEGGREKVDAAGVLIRAGFDPAAALTAVGLDPIKHLGLLPVTVRPIEETPTEQPPQLVGKASSRREFLGLRRTIDQRTVPAVRSSIVGVLSAQRTHIAQAVRSKGAHLQKKPSDTTVWWNESREDERLTTALRPHVAGIAQTVTARAKEVLDKPSKAEFEDRVETELLRNIGLRIAGINKHTRDAIADAIREGFADGLSVAEVADLIEESTLFSELRAETIARTETMFAYNAAALDSYAEFGVERVEALDGDEDLECASRDGQVYTLDEAANIEDHPNGTLDWAPYFGEAKATPVATPPLVPQPVAAPLSGPPDWLPAILAAMSQKAEPVTVHVVTGDRPSRMQTVIDYDQYGDFAGYHEVALATRDDKGDILVEAD